MRSLAHRILETVVDGRWPVAEVFLKRGVGLRCEFGSIGIRSLEWREESGVSLRVWSRDGKEGFVHADSPTARGVEELVRSARLAASYHTGGPIPRLPRGDPGHAPAAGVCERATGDQGEVQEFAHRLIGAFLAAGREATGLRSGWIESGGSSVWIVNSLAREVTSSKRVASVGLMVGECGTDAQERQPVASLGYSALGESLSGLDPRKLAEEASWRAAAPIGGRPLSARGVPVALEPRAAAAWLRSLIPHFIGQQGRRDRKEMPGPPAPELSLHGREGIDLIDDPSIGSGPLAPPFDGEGRTVGVRVLVKDGHPVGRFVDSRDEEVAEEELGPMRRDSFRDNPWPGPMNLYLAPGQRTRDELLHGLGRGLFVTSLIPHSGPGSDRFVAGVSGIWVEAGKARHPVVRSLLIMPALGSLARVAERGLDLEFDAAGPSVGSPTVIIEGADLREM